MKNGLIEFDKSYYGVGDEPFALVKKLLNSDEFMKLHTAGVDCKITYLSSDNTLVAEFGEKTVLSIQILGGAVVKHSVN